MLIRPAIKADTKDFPVLQGATFRALVAEQDGQLVGIAGYMYDGNILQGFSSQKEAIKPKTIIKLARGVIEMYQDAKSPIYAKANSEFDNSKRFLVYLGFEEMANGLFVWSKK